MSISNQVDRPTVSYSSDTNLPHPILHSKTKYSYMCAQGVQTHTYITNYNSIKVKYLLHRISHHNVNTQFAQRQHYYTQWKYQPNLPQGLQLVNFILEVLDILRKLFISIIYYPSRIFIGYKASVSLPCLASISKGSMRLKGSRSGTHGHMARYTHPSR